MAAGRNSWTPAEEARLRELYPWRRTSEVAAALASEGFPARGEKAVSSRAKVLGIRKDPSIESFAHMRAYSDEENGWLAGFIPGHTESVIIGAFEARFGRRLTRAQVKNRKSVLKVKSGTCGGRWTKERHPSNKGKRFPGKTSSTSFRKGNVPHNAGELLDTRVDPDGYTYIKVDPRNARHAMAYWIPYAKFVWMQANGREWPEGHNCVFADRDKTNFDPGNIVPVPRDLYPLVVGAVRGGIAWCDRESLEVAMTAARVTRKRYELEKGRKR